MTVTVPAGTPIQGVTPGTYGYKGSGNSGGNSSDVIGAGPNAGLTPDQIPKNETTHSTYNPLNRNPGESDASYAARIRSQNLLLVGGSNPVAPPTPTKSTPSSTQATAAGVQSNASSFAAGLSGGQGFNVNDPGSGGASMDQPLTEDEVYRKMLKQSQGIIDGIQSGYDTEIKANTDASNMDAAKAQQDQSAMAAASGLIGSSAAIAGAAKTASDSSTALAKENAPIVAARQTAVANALQTIASNAMTEYSTEFDQAQTQRTNAIQAITAMGNAEVNWDAFKNTPAYAQVVSQLGGDPNYADAIFTLSKPQGVVDPNLSKVIGNTYYQITKDPVTGKISQSSFDLPYDVPKNWTFQKVGTNAAIVYDPNNYNPADPSTFKNVYIDPFTGQVTDGTGASNSTDNTGSGDTAGTAARNIQSLLPAAPDGTPADMSQPLSQAIQTYGLDSLTSAIIQNEGGSPSGVQNNPGNVKYTGAAGQTDSGVKASDGGTFASYDSPEAGQKAVQDLITTAASGQSSAYGASPTLAGFIGKYTNTGDTGVNGLATGEYGKLSSVPGFDPTKPGVDQDALNYLKVYLQSGKQPTSTNTLGIRSGSNALLPQIASRAADVYYQATGQSLPDENILTTNKKLISGNNSILNNLSLQEGTIGANANLLAGKVTAANLNQNAPAINKVLDSVATSLGNVDTASLLAQSSTLQNELGSLLALKNATGTTVHDKLESANLIDSSYTADQIASVVNTLMQEAQNSHAAILTANGKVYSQIDPLGLDPENPLTNPSSFASSIGLNLDAIKADYPNMSDEEIIQQYLDSQ